MGWAKPRSSRPTARPEDDTPVPTLKHTNKFSMEAPSALQSMEKECTLRSPKKEAWQPPDELSMALAALEDDAEDDEARAMEDVGRDIDLAGEGAGLEAAVHEEGTEALMPSPVGQLSAQRISRTALANEFSNSMGSGAEEISKTDSDEDDGGHEVVYERENEAKAKLMRGAGCAGLGGSRNSSGDNTILQLAAQGKAAPPCRYTAHASVPRGFCQPADINWHRIQCTNWYMMQCTNWHRIQC